MAEIYETSKRALEAFVSGDIIERSEISNLTNRTYEDYEFVSCLSQLSDFECGERIVLLRLALNNLIRYPHGHWDILKSHYGLSERELDAIENYWDEWRAD